MEIQAGLRHAPADKPADDGEQSDTTRPRQPATRRSIVASPLQCRAQILLFSMATSLTGPPHNATVQ